MDTKQSKPFQLKESPAEKGVFEGWASKYGEVDSYADRIILGAYDRTVRELGGSIVILADHDSTRSIGLAAMTLKPQGLWIKAKLSLELQDARDAYVRLRDGLKSGLSIGYASENDRMAKDGVRELLDITLYEVSVVQFPAQSSARILTVKDQHGDSEFQKLFQSIRSLADDARAFRQRHMDRFEKALDNLVHPER